MEPESTQPSQEIESLTQMSKDSVPYRRAPLVEEQIRWALTLSREALLDSINKAKPGESGYLKEETLVYLIRAHYIANQNEITEELWKILYQRCVKLIRAKIPQIDQRSGQAYQHIQARLFEQIIHPEGMQGDFLQVRFWLGFQSLVITTARTLINDAKKDLLIKPLANLPGAELEQAEDEPEELEPGIAKRSSGLPSSIPIERIVTGAEGLKLLQGQVRRVFILHHGLGYAIESNDPDELTVSKILGKSPRTIYYMLSKAEDILKQWRGEINEKSN